MTVIHNHIRPAGSVMDKIEALEILAVDFAPVDWTLRVAVSEEAETEEWEGDLFAEEDFAD